MVHSEDLGGTKFFKVLGLDSIREVLASSFLFSVGVLLQAASLGKHVFDIAISRLHDLNTQLPRILRSTFELTSVDVFGGS